MIAQARYRLESLISGSQYNALHEVWEPLRRLRTVCLSRPDRMYRVKDVTECAVLYYYPL